MNWDGETPLHSASNQFAAIDALKWSDSITTNIELLLDRGANTEARDNLGYTPLHQAAFWNTPLAIVAVLLDGGANIEARDDRGQTPLHIAAFFGERPAVISLLLDRGANFVARDKEGFTPCHNVALNDALATTEAYDLLCR